MKCKICGGKLSDWYQKLFDDRHGYPGEFDVKKCLICGFGQTSPQISANKIADIYSKYYPWKNTDTSKVKKQDFIMPGKFKIWRKGLYINGQYHVKPKTKVLDVGCGLGYSLLELESIGCKAYGVDPDKNALKVSKKFGLNFKVGFIEDNPFPTEKFDYIIANQVLEHTNNPTKFLKMISKRLKDNGQIILSFPNVNSLTRIIFKNNWLHWHIPYHLNFFTKKSINLMAKKLNLKVVKLKTETPNMWSNLQIRRIFQKPIIGTRDMFWDGKTSKGKQNTFDRLASRLNYLLEEYNLLNRLIDICGFGESFVVILKRSTISNKAS